MFSVLNRYGFFFAGVLALMAAVPTAALAGKAHFVGAVGIDVNIPDLEVTVSGKIAGLGNQDVVVTCDVAGSADTYFVNQGGNEAPGKNKVPFKSLASGVFRPDAKNGTVSFTLTVDLKAALDALAAAAVPPNDNWTTDIRNVQVTSVLITVEQPAGTVVLQQTLTP
jgi:hypothetical protein